MRAVVGPARASRLWTRYSVVREPTGGDNGSDLRGALPTALPLFSDSRLFFFLRLLHWHVRTIVSLSLSRFACIFLVPPLCLRVFSCLEILYLVQGIVVSCVALSPLIALLSCLLWSSPQQLVAKIRSACTCWGLPLRDAYVRAAACCLCCGPTCICTAPLQPFLPLLVAFALLVV